MAELYRGSPAMAAASSLIIPINTHLTLRGLLGQQLLATYGPLPQNELLRRAPATPGTTVVQQVASPLRGIASRWYCAVAYPGDANAVSATWMQLNLASVEEAFSAAVAQVVAEKQFPCAIPFFAERESLSFDPDCAASLAAMMVSVVGDAPGFFFITDLAGAHDALNAALQPVAAPEMEASVVEDTETAAEGEDAAIQEWPEPIEPTYGLPEGAPKKRRGRPRKDNV